LSVLDGLEFYGELARRLRLLRHRMIFAMGDVLDEEKRNVLAATGTFCLAKPFDLDEVLWVVHRFLASAPAPGARHTR
jgi:CheY-like chemotaxis protein